tara:strand:+ start:443 stop:865 length:423 start_codon:yes stop_codon:yes gene_type:complete
MKTNELTDIALDWAVAKCEGRKMQRNPMGPQSGPGWWIWEETPSGLGGIFLDKSIYMEIGPRVHPKTRQSTEKFSPSIDWAQGGPIIERELLLLRPYGLSWECSMGGINWFKGTAPLIAAMRCYVASKLGDDVELPEGLA